MLPTVSRHRNAGRNGGPMARHARSGITPLIRSPPPELSQVATASHGRKLSASHRSFPNPTPAPEVPPLRPHTSTPQHPDPMSPNEILPWRFVTTHATRRDFAQHLRTLPTVHRREAVNLAQRTGVFPLRAWESLRIKVEILRNAPRVKSCTESSNVSLSHATDSLFFNPSCANSAIRFVKAVDADRECNPHLWND